MIPIKSKYGHPDTSSVIDNPGFWKFCLLAAIFTGIVELGSLLGLTFVTSHSLDYFAFHQVTLSNLALVIRLLVSKAIELAKLEYALFVLGLCRWIPFCGSLSHDFIEVIYIFVYDNM